MKLEKRFHTFGQAVVKDLKPVKGIIEADNYTLYNKSAIKMPQILNQSITLTILTPPLWSDLEQQNSKLGSTYEEYLKLLTKTAKEVYRVTKTNGYLIFIIPSVIDNNHIYLPSYNLNSSLLKIGWQLTNKFIWHKTNFKPTSISLNDLEDILVWQKIDVKKASIKFNADSIWSMDCDDNQSLKSYPLELSNKLVEIYSSQNDIILSPFLYNNQIGISAVSLNRQFKGYDLSLQSMLTLNDKLKDSGYVSLK